MDYRRPVPHTVSPRDDRVLLLASALLTALIGLGLFGAMVDVLIVTWPSFGATLIAVPVGLVALAFLSIAITAVRAARHA